ncbi:Protein TANC2, partial [Orchesella cincta]
EPTSPAKKFFTTRKKSRHDEFISNFKLPNPVTLFSNRVAKKTPFFTKVKCHAIGSSPLLQKRSKPAPSAPARKPSANSTTNEAVGKQVFDSVDVVDEDLYCIPRDVALLSDVKENSIYQSVAERSFQQPQPPLRPLFFEVPLEESQVFVPRNWIFASVLNIFNENIHTRGVILYGVPGTGKTAVALELVEYSCFGRKREHDLQLESGRISAMSVETDDSDDMNRETEDLSALKTLVQNLDNRLTCLVPEFIHSLAAQLCQAPALAPYRDYLLENAELLDGLSIENCTINPGPAFLNGIIEPLNLLRRANKLGDGHFLIIIDSIGEAECHKTSTRDTISSFLSKHILRVPFWLKFIVTIRTSQLEILSLIPFKKISLDTMSEDIEEDLHSYINYRISANICIKENVTASLVSSNKSELNILKSLKNHLAHLSGGCFLYLKLTLDLIQHGHLVIKSSGFKVLPVSLSEVFSLHCNLRFPTSRAFNMVHPILATCLAALNPLTLLEVYHSINSLRATENLEWTQFLRIFKNLKGLLIKRLDGTYMFFHSSFRDWLVRRDESDAKFLCDVRVGNSAIALRLTSIEAPLSPNKTIELAHHILKGGVFKSSSGSSHKQGSNGIPYKDLQAIWLLTATKDIGNAITSFSNIYTPNPKITRLFLQAGASPNQKTSYFNNAPLLGAYSAAGFYFLSALLLEFGADVNGENDDGDLPLHLACQYGHVDIVGLLIDEGALVGQLNKSNEPAILKAANNNQVEVLQHIMSLEEAVFAPMDKITAIKETLVAGCACNYFDVVDLCAEYVDDFNFHDTRTGETPISMASKRGHSHIVSAIILEGGNPDMPNEKGFPPLILAAKEQHHRVIEALVEGGSNLNATDPQSKTALMYAAKQNDLISLEYLIKKGADLKLRDKDGICALGWACLRSNMDAVELLLDFDVEVNEVDHLGRTPLDLAAFTGAEEIATMLLEKGAMIEHIDVQGIRPLDRAVGCGHTGLVQLFLRRGAKLGSNTWAMANSKPQIMYTAFHSNLIPYSICLLNKLLEDGVFLLHKGQYREAAHRFQYSLRKVPSHQYNEESQVDIEEIWKNLTLNLIRCKIRMNESAEAMTLINELAEKYSECSEVFFEKAQVHKSMGNVDAARKEALFAMALNEKDTSNNSELRTQIEELLDEISK